MNRHAMSWLILVSLIFAAPARSAPTVFEERAKLVLPNSDYDAIADGALDGDRAVLTTSEERDSGYWNAAYVYERGANGQWVYTATLHDALSGVYWPTSLPVAIEGNVIAFVVGDAAVHVYERGSIGVWSRTAVLSRPQGFSAIGGNIEIDAGTILVTGVSNMDAAAVYRKNASGQWTSAGVVTASSLQNLDDEARGGDADIAGNTLFVASPSNGIFPTTPQIEIFEETAGGWSLTSSLMNPIADSFPFGWTVAAGSRDSALTFAPSNALYGFRRSAGNTWSYDRLFQSPDALLPESGGMYSLDADGNLAVVAKRDDDSRGIDSGVIHVYRTAPGSSLEPVARLFASDAGPNTRLGWGLVMISGRRIIAQTSASSAALNAAYIFDLPADLTQPAMIQDNFEDGNSVDWTALAGSQFSVATIGQTRVYRQSSTVGTAAALLTNSDWTSQAIQADVRPTAFSTTDRWFGLMTRYTDAQNYYYVTLRNTNTVLLRRMVNGVFVTLASAPLTVVANRNYRVRLESAGTWHRVYVDGYLVVQARDRSHTHGRTGVVTYQTRADFDNVVATPSAVLTLYSENFETEVEGPWTYGGISAWNVATDGSKVYFQSSVADGARASTGVPTTGDQIVQARVKATTFASGTTAQERWFGLMARRKDDANYYYLTMRNSNTVSLRKVVNGSVQVLKSAPLPVSTGIWYILRLEAIGTALRAYVNGALVLEAADASHMAGTYGPVMYKTATEYDNILVIQP